MFGDVAVGCLCLHWHGFHAIACYCFDCMCCASLVVILCCDALALYSPRHVLALVVDILDFDALAGVH